MKNLKKVIVLIALIMPIYFIGQINPASLKTQIDNDITNKPAGTVTRAATGADMKTMVDYTTQVSNLKENTANKSTDVNLGSSNVLFPTQNATKIYVDNQNTKTQGSITANVTPAYLTYDINMITTTAASQYVQLLDLSSYKMGSSIILNWEAGYYNYYIQPQAGQYIVYDGGDYTEMPLRALGSFRFTKISSTKWLYELIVPTVEQQIWSDGLTMLGSGTISDRVRVRAFGKLCHMYAVATSNPVLNNAYYVGYYMPTGVTQTVVRTGTGLYEFRFVGDATLEALDCTGGTGKNIFLTVLNSPTLQPSGLLYSDVSGTRTITFQYSNYVSGVLTDGFNHGEIVDIKFFGPNIN